MSDTTTVVEKQRARNKRKVHAMSSKVSCERVTTMEPEREMLDMLVDECSQTESALSQKAATEPPPTPPQLAVEQNRVLPKKYTSLINLRARSICYVPFASPPPLFVWNSCILKAIGKTFRAENCCIEAESCTITAYHCIIKGMSNIVSGEDNIIVGNHNTVKHGLNNYTMGMYNTAEPLEPDTPGYSAHPSTSPAMHLLLHETSVAHNEFRPELCSVSGALEQLGFVLVMKLVQMGFHGMEFDSRGLPPGPDLSCICFPAHIPSDPKATVVVISESSDLPALSKCDRGECDNENTVLDTDSIFSYLGIRACINEAYYSMVKCDDNSILKMLFPETFYMTSKDKAELVWAYMPYVPPLEVVDVNEERKVSHSSTQRSLSDPRMQNPPASSPSARARSPAQLSCVSSVDILPEDLENENPLIHFAEQHEFGVDTVRHVIVKELVNKKPLHARWCYIEANGAQIAAEKCIVKGSNNVIRGMHNIIVGEKNDVLYGTNNYVIGVENKVFDPEGNYSTRFPMVHLFLHQTGLKLHWKNIHSVYDALTLLGFKSIVSLCQLAFGDSMPSDRNSPGADICHLNTFRGAAVVVRHSKCPEWPWSPCENGTCANQDISPSGIYATPRWDSPTTYMPLVRCIERAWEDGSKCGACVRDMLPDVGVDSAAATGNDQNMIDAFPSRLGAEKREVDVKHRNADATELAWRQLAPYHTFVHFSGSMNEPFGRNQIVYGTHRRFSTVWTCVEAHNCELTVRHCIVKGMNNKITGSFNVVLGDGNTLSDSCTNNYMMGLRNTQVSAVSFEGNSANRNRFINFPFAHTFVHNTSLERIRHLIELYVNTSLTKRIQYAVKALGFLQIISLCQLAFDSDDIHLDPANGRMPGPDFSDIRALHESVVHVLHFEGRASPWSECEMNSCNLVAEGYREAALDAILQEANVILPLDFCTKLKLCMHMHNSPSTEDKARSKFWNVLFQHTDASLSSPDTKMDTEDNGATSSMTCCVQPNSTLQVSDPNDNNNSREGRTSAHPPQESGSSGGTANSNALCSGVANVTTMPTSVAHDATAAVVSSSSSLPTTTTAPDTTVINLLLLELNRRCKRVVFQTSVQGNNTITMARKILKITQGTLEASWACIEAHESYICATHCIIKGTNNNIFGRHNVVMGDNNVMMCRKDNNYIMGSRNRADIESGIELFNKLDDHFVYFPYAHAFVHETCVERNMDNIASECCAADRINMDAVLNTLGFMQIMELLQLGFNDIHCDEDGWLPGPNLGDINSYFGSGVVVLYSPDHPSPWSECDLNACDLAQTAVPQTSLDACFPGGVRGLSLCEKLELCIKAAHFQSHEHENKFAHALFPRTGEPGIPNDTATDTAPSTEEEEVEREFIPEPETPSALSRPAHPRITVYPAPRPASLNEERQNAEIAILRHLKYVPAFPPHGAPPSRTRHALGHNEEGYTPPLNDGGYDSYNDSDDDDDFMSCDFAPIERVSETTQARSQTQDLDPPGRNITRFFNLQLAELIGTLIEPREEMSDGVQPQQPGPQPKTQQSERAQVSNVGVVPKPLPQTPRNPENVVPVIFDEEARDGDLMCKICFTNRACIMTRPCNHVIMCRKCTSSLYTDSNVQCPTCRKNITEFHAIFT